MHIQHNARRSSQLNKARKRKNIFLERNKTAPICDYMIMYIENSKEWTKQTPELMNSANLQVTNSILKNQLYLYILEKNIFRANFNTHL